MYPPPTNSPYPLQKPHQINDRYEFYEELDLDRDNYKYLSPNADRSTPNKYRLHSVLVHSGGVHGGHYYAFINPDGKQWLKFDDDKVWGLCLILHTILYTMHSSLPLYYTTPVTLPPFPRISNTPCVSNPTCISTPHTPLVFPPHTPLAFPNQVTKEQPRRAIQEQWGGDDDLSNGNPPPSNPPFNQPLKITRFSNAYMLVYVRVADWDHVMCTVTEQDIYEHVRVRLKVRFVGGDGKECVFLGVRFVLCMCCFVHVLFCACVFVGGSD